MATSSRVGTTPTASAPRIENLGAEDTQMRQVSRAVKSALPTGMVVYGVAGTAVAFHGALAVAPAVALVSIVAACATLVMAVINYTRNRTIEGRAEALELANKLHRMIGRSTSASDLDDVAKSLQVDEDNFRKASLTEKFRELSLLCYVKRHKLAGAPASLDAVPNTFVENFQKSLDQYNKSWLWSADRSQLSRELTKLRQDLVYGAVAVDQARSIALGMITVYNNLLISGKNTDLLGEVFSVTCECWDYCFLQAPTGQSRRREAHYVI